MSETREPGAGLHLILRADNGFPNTAADGRDETRGREKNQDLQRDGGNAERTAIDLLCTCTKICRTAFLKDATNVDLKPTPTMSTFTNRSICVRLNLALPLFIMSFVS